MKCHYVNDSELGKVLIPGCYSRAEDETAMCTCSQYQEGYSKQELAQKLRLKDQWIMHLERKIQKLEDRLWKHERPEIFAITPVKPKLKLPKP